MNPAESSATDNRHYHAASTVQKDAALLQPGHNCWRIERASRLQFLIDGSEYFSALRAALRRAQRSIFILGWDIDSRMALFSGETGHSETVACESDDDLPLEFGAFLNAVVARRRSLHAHVLSWDYAMLFALEREWLPTVKLNWRTHRRLHFQLDKQHPTGASHHQKVVVIDDCVAFVGGFDITRCRWDTPQHAADDPRRFDADGKGYGPFHDVQMIVEGPVAAALGELARERWLHATGRRARVTNNLRFFANASGNARAKQNADSKQNTDSSPWPPSLPAALDNVDIAIARTAAEFAGRPAVAEIRQFYSDAIGAARRHIFLENQYFSSPMLAEILAERLERADAPEVVVITPQRESGWLEENTMGALRANLYCALRERDKYQRFRPYYPQLDGESRYSDPSSANCLNVHSKVMMVDDDLLTIGSANVSNRSMHLDTECNLILEAGMQGANTSAVRGAIAALRNRLLAEHLDTGIDSVAAATRQGLIAAIEQLRGGARTLAPVPIAAPQENPISPALQHRQLVDPEQPLEARYVIGQYLPPKDLAPARGRAIGICIVALIFSGMAVAWHATPLHNYLDLDSAMRFVESLQAKPLTPLWMLLTYVVGGLLAVPVIVLIAVTGMVFGPWPGLPYALGGSLASAATTYWIGSNLGRDVLQRWSSRRLRRLNRQLTQRGLIAVIIIRMMPIAPFTVVNVLAGAAQLRLRDFLLGTALGMLPGIVMTVLFVDRIAAAIRQPSLASMVLLAVAVAIIAIVTGFMQRWLRRRECGEAAANRSSSYASKPPA